MSALGSLGKQWDETFTKGHLATADIAPLAQVDRNRKAMGLPMYEKPDWDSAPVEELPTKKIKPTQAFLWRGQHDSVRQATGELPPVHVVRNGSRHFVVDGHHRLDLALERGQKTIRAKVVDA